MKNNQSGRSMVEMLGVLAIIGVLSAGGLAGYSKAMFKHKLNNTMDQITMLVTNIRTMYGTQGDYVGLNSRKAVKLGIVPAVMVGAGEDATPASGDDPNDEDYVAAKPDSQTLTNPFQGGVAISAENLNGVTSGGFYVTYDSLPKEACIALATADFGGGAGSGFIGTQIGSAYSGEYGEATEGHAFDMSGALTNCTSDSMTITWHFY